MKIKVNLYENWKLIILKEIKVLKKKGIQFSKSNNNRFSSFDEYTERLIVEYFNYKLRLIPIKKREIKVPKNFKIPNHLKRGYDLLINKIETGQNLFPHLSRQMREANFFDGLLFDWNIFHFHLGTKEDKKYKGMIEGTKEVLYAIVTDEYFYILSISNHNWTDQKYLKIIKDNYPEILKSSEIRGIVPETLSEDEISRFRKNGLNYLTEIDGKGYMFGWPYSTAKLSILATMIIDDYFFFFESVEELLHKNTKNFEMALSKSLKQEISELHLLLISINENTLRFLSAKYRFNITINYIKENNLIQFIKMKIEFN